MPTQSLANATVGTVANVYFEGRCVSHSLQLADGSKKSIGVILPATLRFNTAAAERMECVAGRCEYRLDSTNDAWSASSPGESFSIPADASFEIRV
ncbi:MAG: pyrimidine/purine nucleoside phosphorylase, partial [Burkholderiales bacterium]